MSCKIIILVICSLILGSSGCAKTYHFTLKNEKGEVVYNAEYEAYALGNIKYGGGATFDKDGNITSINLLFERDISSPIGEVMHGLSETAGAASNKF